MKTRGHIYYRMGFIYVSYLICQVCRLLMDSTRIFVADPKLEMGIYRWLKVLNSIATRSKWILVYYFVIIVRDLKLRLAVEDPREFGPKLRRQRMFNNSILAIFIVCQMLIFTLHVLQYLVFSKDDKETEQVFRGIQYTALSIKIIPQVIEFIMAFILMDIVRFYIRKKWEKERAANHDSVESEDNSSSCFMKLPKNPRQRKVIIIVIALVTCHVLQTLLDFYSPIKYILEEFINNDIIKPTIMDLAIYFLNEIFDFITSLALLYIGYRLTIK
jgi:hypothetical protein